MAIITNIGFEDGTGGTATSWTLSTIATAQRINGFAVLTGGSATNPFEGFEGGWLNNENYDREIDILANTLAGFDSANPESAEDFEEEWLDNQSYLFAFNSSVLSFADLDPVESDPDLGNADRFENDWFNNQGYDFTLGSVFTADLDPSTGGTADTLENDWLNDNYDFTLGSGTLMVFDSVGGSENFEDFEETFQEQTITVTPGGGGGGRVNLTAHGLSNGDIVTFRNSGGILPTGMNVLTQYIVANALFNSFEITTNGNLVFIEDNGSGQHFVNADPGTYWLDFMESI